MESPRQEFFRRLNLAPGGTAEIVHMRQDLLKLPRTGAVLFSIHTWVLPFAALTEEQSAALEAHPVEYAGRGLGE